MKNKKALVLFITILMIVMTAVVASAQEANYQVVVTWETRGISNRDGSVHTRPERRESTVTVTASSVSEAESKASELVRSELGFGKIIRVNAVRL